MKAQQQPKHKLARNIHVIQYRPEDPEDFIATEYDDQQGSLFVCHLQHHDGNNSNSSTNGDLAKI